MGSLTVAHIIGGLGMGGIESFLQGITALAGKEGSRSVVLAVYQRDPVKQEVSFPSASVYWGHLLYGRKGFQRFIKEIFRREAVDVVHSHLGELSGDVLRLAQECGVRVRLAHSHDLGGVGGMRWYLYRRYARWGLSTATHFSAVCASAGRVFQGVKSKPFRIIPAGIDLEIWKRDEEGGKCLRQVLGVEDGECLLLQVGRLAREKNPLFSLFILKVLRDKGFPAVLVYAGDGPLRRRLEARAQEWKIADWIRLLGIRRDIRELMSTADLLLVPSLREGLPRVILEAWCVGLPFLLSDGVEVSDVFSGDYTLPLSSPEDWAKAVMKRAGGQGTPAQLLMDISLQGAWRACRELYSA